MFDERLFVNLSEGKERIKYLKKCIDEADKEKDYKMSLELRYLHIKESTFNEDNLDSLIVFPEYMALFDKHPDLHDQYTFMYAFKWIIESIMNFPQVSIEMAESYFEEYKKRCEMYGYTLKIYYMKQINFFEKIDPERTMKLLELFRQEERDRMSDEIGDDMSLEICTELDYGSEERALKLLDELRKKGIRSGEVPQITYGKCVEYFTKKGNFAEAEFYADLLEPMTRGTGTYYMMEMSNVMILRTLTNMRAALSIFRRYIEHYIASKNVKFRFYFANASYRLFRQLKNNGNDTVTLKLPRIFEMYSESGEYDTEALSCYFRKQAEEGAEKFDKRNRNTMYSDILNFEYPDTPSARTDLPEHGNAEKIPAVLGVPFTCFENIPSDDEILAAVEALENTVVTSSFSDEETGLFSVRVYNEDADLETEFHFHRNRIDEITLSPWEFSSRHVIDEDELEAAAEKFSVFLSINVVHKKNAEGHEYNLMLRLADTFNRESSPVIIDYSTLSLLSAKWVDIQAKSQTPPYEFYMYNVFVNPDDDESCSIMTAGLKKFGTKELLVTGVAKEKVPVVFYLVNVIARNICSYMPLPDEGSKALLNAVLDNRTMVYYSWKKGKEYTSPSGKTEYYAVPEIYLGHDSDSCGLTEITNEIMNRIAFHAPHRYYNLDNRLCGERFEYARTAFAGGGYDSFVVGFEADNPADPEESFEIYAEVTDGETLSARIIEASSEMEEYRKGAEVKIDPERVYFWKLTKDGERFMADDVYKFKE